MKTAAVPRASGTAWAAVPVTPERRGVSAREIPCRFASCNPPPHEEQKLIATPRPNAHLSVYGGHVHASSGHMSLQDGRKGARPHRALHVPASPAALTAPKA